MKKVSIPLKRRASLLLRKILPVFAWLGVATWISLSWADKSSYAELRGMAQTQTWEVSGIEPGRLTEIRVTLFNPVMAGEVLAVIDDTPLLAEIVIARKSVDQTQAEVDSLRHTLRVAAEEVASDWNADLRRFHVDVEKARLKGLSLSLNRAELLASIGRQTALAKSHKSRGAILETQVATAELEFRRQETLVLQRAGSKAQAESAKISWLAARSEMALNSTQIEDALQRITEAEVALTSMAAQAKENELQESESLARLAAFNAIQPDALPFADDSRLLALHVNVEVQRARVDALLLRRENLMIRAGAAAVVQRIDAKPGQAVLAGEAIVTLAAKHSQLILAWAPPAISKRLKAGDDLLVSSAGTKPLKATLLRLGPAVEELPLAMRRNPAIAEYGHPFLIGLPENAEFIPGESVQVLALLVR